MSFLDAIFGRGQNDAMNSLIGNQNLANTTTQYQQNQLANGYNQALMNQFQMMRNKPKWVYNGVECSVQEFAELMWPDDEQARLMFVLKHGGV